ncbi:hypothetical protein ACTXOR_03425 [Arthrobacter rhombi]|uniref:hypothetical protein n=1 Tax=Arthrobacter rhombi TaxID=71253 RepID=UPI003FD619E3
MGTIVTDLRWTSPTTERQGAIADSVQPDALRGEGFFDEPHVLSIGLIILLFVPCVDSRYILTQRGLAATDSRDLRGSPYLPDGPCGVLALLLGEVDSQWWGEIDRILHKVRIPLSEIRVGDLSNVERAKTQRLDREAARVLARLVTSGKARLFLRCGNTSALYGGLLSLCANGYLYRADVGQIVSRAADELCEGLMGGPVISNLGEHACPMDEDSAKSLGALTSDSPHIGKVLNRLGAWALGQGRMQADPRKWNVARMPSAALGTKTRKLAKVIALICKFPSLGIVVYSQMSSFIDLAVRELAIVDLIVQRLSNRQIVSGLFCPSGSSKGTFTVHAKSWGATRKELKL